MQVLVISERTLESAFLLFAALCLFVYLFFLVFFFEALHRSLAPSAALISPPLHFLHRPFRFLSSAHYRPTLSSSLCPEEGHWSSHSLPADSPGSGSFYPSIHPPILPLLLLIQGPKAQTHFFLNLRPRSSRRPTRTHSICTATSRGLCKAPSTIYVWKDEMDFWRVRIFIGIQ